MEVYIGAIMQFPYQFNRVLLGWEHCNGQVLPVRNHEALFSLRRLTGGFVLWDMQSSSAVVAAEAAFGKSVVRRTEWGPGGLETMIDDAPNSQFTISNIYVRS